MGMEPHHRWARLLRNVIHGLGGMMAGENTVTIETLPFLLIIIRNKRLHGSLETPGVYRKNVITNNNRVGRSVSFSYVSNGNSGTSTLRRRCSCPCTGQGTNASGYAISTTLGGGGHGGRKAAGTARHDLVKQRRRVVRVPPKGLRRISNRSSEIASVLHPDRNSQSHS